MKELLTSGIFQIISLVATAVVAWIFGGKATKKREWQTTDLDNEIKSADYYKKLLDQLAGQLEKAIAEVMELQDEVLKLMKTNRELIDKNNRLMESNQELLEDLKKYKQLNGKR